MRITDFSLCRFLTTIRASLETVQTNGEAHYNTGANVGKRRCMANFGDGYAGSAS